MGHFAAQVPAAQFLPDCHPCSHTVNSTAPCWVHGLPFSKLWLNVRSISCQAMFALPPRSIRLESISGFMTSVVSPPEKNLCLQ